MLKFLSSDVSQETASLDINSCVGTCISSSGSNTDLNYSKIFNKTMNSLLIVSAIVCVMLLLFIAYAFINNSDFKLIDEISNSDTRLEIDTTSGNETANETENQ